MKIFKIEKEQAKHITHFDFDFLLNPIFSSAGEVKTAFFILEPGGIIGYHQTSVPQLMLVLSGAGEVCSEDRKYQPVKKGHAVFWAQGEWHETISDSGMTALVIEGPALKESYIHLKELV